MKPVWHALSALLIPDPPIFATPGVLRIALAGGRPVDLVYAGDAMWPAIRHGQRIRMSAPGPGSVAAGSVVLACPAGVPDLLRIVGVERERTVAIRDAIPGERVTIDASGVMAVADLPSRRSSEITRTLRRTSLDVLEAIRGRVDPGKNPSESVLRKYDFQAPYYLDQARRNAGGALPSGLLEHLPREGRVLVAGCGTGRECFALEKLGLQAAGVDFSPAMIEAARREARRLESGTSFHAADLCEHRESEGSLGAVLFTYDTYSFIPGRPRRVALLGRMRRWLGPGGVILLSARRTGGAWDRLILTLQWLSDGAGESWGRSHTRWIATDGSLNRSFVRFFTDGSLKAEVREAGFETRARTPTHLVLSSSG